MRLLIPATLMLSVCLVASTAQGQIPRETSPEEAGAVDDTESRYYSPRPAPTPQEIIQYKAQIRGQQRMARMASMEWYGMSASRPRASVTPFTGMYSPVWQMPGGRPFAWSPSRYQSPVIIAR